jgi:PIN domain nuclease of toxin-antitoxin system
MLERLEVEGQPIAIRAITLWELAVLVERGRITASASLEDWLHETVSHPMINVLPLTPAIAARSVRLGQHFPKDPADRLIVATALCHGLPLMTADQQIRNWGRVMLA